MKALKKRFFVHYHGSELRQNIQTSFHNLAEKIFISTPDLKRYSKNLGGRELIHIPNPVFTDGVNPVNWKDREEHLEGDEDLLIAHLPSVREVKGTENVISAVEDARSIGARITLDIIEDVTVDDAMKRLDRADICIDWMSTEYDIHGVVSVEAMLRAIPTICNIDRKLYSEEIPLIETKPERLSKVLLDLDSRRKDLPLMGERSREYVLDTHEPLKVAKLLERYI